VAATGVPMVGPEEGSRTRPDGKVLHWKALRVKDDHGGLLPFFIEWSRDSAHPSEDAPAGCRLVDFSVAYAEGAQLSTLFAHLGLDVKVVEATPSRLRGKILSAKGSLELTS
jgi:Glyoxalase-like domain